MANQTVESAVALGSVDDLAYALWKDLRAGAERATKPENARRWCIAADAIDAGSSSLIALARHAEDMYTPRRLRSGRIVYDPHEPLKSIQRALQRLLRRGLRPSPIRHHNSVRAAKVHAGQPWLACTDIQRCFPSVSAQLVRQTFAPLATTELIIGLTTRHGWLVTGAPSSPVILDIVLWSLDRELHEIAQRLAVNLTRYVDNIDTSGAIHEAVEAMAIEVRRACNERGLRLRVGPPTPRSRRRETLGLSTIRGSIPKRKRRRIRSEIRATAYRARCAGEPISTARLHRAHGLIGYVRRLHPDDAARLDAMLQNSG